MYLIRHAHLTLRRPVIAIRNAHQKRSRLARAKRTVPTQGRAAGSDVLAKIVNLPPTRITTILTSEILLANFPGQDSLCLQGLIFAATTSAGPVTSGLS